MINIGQSSFKLFLSKVSTSIISFVAIVYFSREFGPSQIGVYFLFQTLINISSIPADLGIKGAAEKRISEGDWSGSILSTAILVKLVLLIPISVAIIVFHEPVNEYIGAELATFLILGILLNESSDFLTGILKGELRVGETAILEVVRQISWVAIGVGLSVYGIDVRGLIYALIISLSLTTFLAWYMVNTKVARPSWKRTVSMYSYARYNIINIVGTQVYTWMDIAIIGFVLTSYSVGIYEVTWRITAISVLFSKSVTASIFPQMSQWHNKNKYDEISNLVSDSISYSILLTIPALFGIILLSQKIIRFTFGEEYISGSIVLTILMFDRVCESIHHILRGTLQAIDRPELAAKATISGIVLNLALNISLINTFGIVGVAIGTTASMAIAGTFLHYHYLSNNIDLEIHTKEIVWMIISSLIMSISLYAYDMTISITSTIELIAVIVASALVYLIIVAQNERIKDKMLSIVRPH